MSDERSTDQQEQPPAGRPWWGDSASDPWRSDRDVPEPTVPLGPATPATTLPHEDLWSSYLGRPEPGQEPPAGERRRGTGVAAMMITALLAAVLGGGVGAGLTLLATDDDRSNPPPQTNQPQLPPGTTTVRESVPGSVASIASRLLPSVVEITVGDAAGDPSGTGSGVVISTDGYIITNNHVVEDAQQIQVSIGNRDIDARLIGTDPDNDLAVIKAAATDLTPAALGSSTKLRVGDPVIAIGSPLGLSGTVTTGIVSALNRQVRVPQDGAAPKVLYGAIQTDAAINPGNSGGALVDAAGNVIGINSAIASLGQGLGGTAGSIGLGFAIPIDLARDVADQLIKTGRVVHPYIGVNIKTIDEATSRELDLPVGALVAEVVPDSPADQAGLQTDDVIIKVGDQKVASSEELVTEIRKRKVGDTVTITYIRDGDERTAELRLAEKPRQS
jgi:S1-C subfamily serine protease